MKRMVSTLGLSVWLGFFLLAGIWHSDMALNGPDAREIVRWAPMLATILPDFAGLPRLSPPIAAASATVCLAVAGLFGAALVELHTEAGTRAARGERLAVAGLLVAAAAAVIARLSGTEIEPVSFGMTFVFAAVATLAALAFDRLVTVDEVPDDEHEFRAAVAVIAHEMARQTKLYTPDGSRSQAHRRTT